MVTHIRRLFPLLTAPLTILLLASGPALALHAGECSDERVELGPLGDGFACGEILVKPHEPEEIDEIVTRQGGNPDTDILGSIDGIGWFTLAVEVGMEFEAVEAYRADPDVEYAEFNGTGGMVAGLPDTAITPSGSLASVAGMLVTTLSLSAMLLARRQREA